MTSVFHGAQRAFSNQVLSLHIITKCSKNENTCSLMLSFLIDYKSFGPQILGSISQFNSIPPYPIPLSGVSVWFLNIFEINEFIPVRSLLSCE